MVTFDEIIDAMRTAYQSLSEPNFTFLHFEERVNPLRELQAGLGNAGIIDDTDPNEDVSFSFLIKSGPASRFLQLSQVGPYASIKVLGEQEHYLSEKDELEPIDILLLDYLKHKGIALIEPSILMMRVPELVLPNTDQNLVTVYHGLFSDTG
jgi:hypothetical protein